MKSEKDEAYKFQTFTVTKPGAGLQFRFERGGGGGGGSQGRILKGGAIKIQFPIYLQKKQKARLIVES